MLWGHTLRSPHAHARIVVDRHLGGGRHARRARGADARGRSRREDATGSSSRTSPCSRTSACATSASPSRSSPRSIRSRRAGRPTAIRVEYEPLEPVVDPERATEQEPLHPDRPTMGHGYRDDPRPNIVRSLVIRHGDPDAEGDVSVSGVYEVGIQDQAFLGPESGLAVPDGEGGVDVYVATQWLHVDRDQVAPCLGLEARAGAHPSRRRRRRVRRAGGPVDADPRRAARAAHEPAREDRLQPRGVVRRPHPPASREDLGGASRDARGEARQRSRAHPARRRRVRVELDRGHVERRVVRLRPVRGRQRADREHVRLHEQSALRRDARLRRGAGVLRPRGADGQARGRAGHRPDRAAAAQRARAGRRDADGTADHRHAAGRGGDPPRGGACRSRSRRSCRATRCAYRAVRATRRAAKE